MNGVLLSRAVLSLKGEEARPFLQGVVTQDVTGGDAVFTALLTPQGKILFDFFLVPHDGGFLIDCDAVSAEALAKRLTLYKLRAKVTIAREPDLAVVVGDAPSSLPDPRLSGLPRRAILRREMGAAADDAYDAARTALGVPEFGRDFASDEMFLLDVNYDALRAVSYAKGCFVGQEVTSRMKRKGEIRKRTLTARFEGSAPAQGTPILAEESAVGELLSGRDGAALALVRLDRLEAATKAGKTLTAEGREVAIDFPSYLERV